MNLYLIVRDCYIDDYTVIINFLSLHFNIYILRVIVSCSVGRKLTNTHNTDKINRDLKPE